MTKKQEKEIVIPILNDEYKVIVCFGEPKYIDKVLKQWGHKVANIYLDCENRRGICFWTKGCHPVIAMRNFPKTPEEIGTLAHEAIHSIGHIFSMIEQEFAEEVFAHSVGAIVRTVLSTKI